MPKKFVWLRDATCPARGPQLQTGQEYDAGDFAPDAVEAWIAEGAAGWADAPEKKRAGRKSGEEE